MPHILNFSPELLQSHCFIDVRTPAEFVEDHIPGAYNVPLLTDEERVEIGIIHKQAGALHARRRGLERTCSRFYQMVEQISAYAASTARPVVIYCWRGGMRSHSVATLVETCGVPALQLKGGYKAFRTEVIDYFERCHFQAPLYVLHGMTGTGKTAFIHLLDRSRWSIIDLEGIACHRGSAFGALGLEQKITQKHFETQLWSHFQGCAPGVPIVLEGESKRIGKYTLPGNLYEKMAESSRIWCHASLHTRIGRLAEEYARLEYRDEIMGALERIRKKLSGEQFSDLKAYVEKWDVTNIARGLIEYYYDKTYYKHRSWEPDLEIECEDFEAAACELEQFVFSRP